MSRFYHRVPLSDARCVQQPFHPRARLTAEFEKPLKKLETLRLWFLTVWSFFRSSRQRKPFLVFPHSVTVLAWQRPAGNPLFSSFCVFFSPELPSFFLWFNGKTITDSLQRSDGNLIVSERVNHRVLNDNYYFFVYFVIEWTKKHFEMFQMCSPICIYVHFEYSSICVHEWQIKAVTWSPDEISWGWRSVSAKQYPSPPWTLLYISCLVEQSATASSPNSVSLGIRSTHRKTWHRNNSQRLFHFTFTLSNCLPALAHIEVSPSVTSVAQHWHKCGRRWGGGDGGEGRAHYSRPASGWVTILHASCHANVPLIWQRSWAAPARPSCQPPIRLRFCFILIVHGLRNKSSSFTDKEAESMRKVKLWWKKCVSCYC